MEKHTPGPWKKAKYKVSDITGGLIAHTRPTGEASSADEANARLIAAAPDLLAAVQGLISRCEYRSIAGDPPDWHIKTMPTTAELNAARVAVEKAVGAA